MNLTLEHILSLPYFSDYKVVSGHNGLNRKISGVNVLEIPYNTSPETQTELMFNDREELIFTAFYSVSKNIEAQLSIIEFLNSNGCTGLVLCYVDNYLKSIPNALIEKSNDLNFPIILAPPDIIYSDAINEIMRKIISTQNEQLILSYKIGQRYSNAILNGSSLSQLLDITYALTKHPVFYFDADEKFYAYYSSIDSPIRRKLTDYVKGNLSHIINERKDYNVKFTIEDNTFDVCFSPIFVNQNYYGTLIILEASSLTAMDNIAITQAKNNFAILALNQINRLNFLNNQKSTFINSLLSSPLHVTENQLLGENPFGLDFTKFNYIMLISGDNLDAPALDDIAALIQSDVIRLHNDFLIHTYNYKHIIVMSNSESELKLRKFADHISVLLWDNKKIRPQIIISNPINSSAEFYSVYNDAQILLNISGIINSDTNIFENRKYGLYCTLYKAAMKSLPETKTQLSQLFGNLIEYDSQNQSELFSTFKELIRHDCNTLETAKDMYLHKNTILQRKRKIIELLDTNPFEGDSYFLYRLAFFISSICNL